MPKGNEKSEEQRPDTHWILFPLLWTKWMPAKRSTHSQWIDTFHFPTKVRAVFLYLTPFKPSTWSYIVSIDYTHHFVNEIDSVLYERTVHTNETASRYKSKPLMRAHQVNTRVLEQSFSSRKLWTTNGCAPFKAKCRLHLLIWTNSIQPTNTCGVGLNEESIVLWQRNVRMKSI